MEMSINSGDVGVNSAGKSRMVSRARQDLWKMKADRNKSRRKWRWNGRNKSITETVETETKRSSSQKFRARDWRITSGQGKREAVVELTDGQAQRGREVK